MVGSLPKMARTIAARLAARCRTSLRITASGHGSARPRTAARTVRHDHADQRLAVGPQVGPDPGQRLPQVPGAGLLLPGALARRPSELRAAPSSGSSARLALARRPTRGRGDAARPAAIGPPAPAPRSGRSAARPASAASRLHAASSSDSARLIAVPVPSSPSPTRSSRRERRSRSPNRRCRRAAAQAESRASDSATVEPAGRGPRPDPHPQQLPAGAVLLDGGADLDAAQRAGAQVEVPAVEGAAAADEAAAGRKRVLQSLDAGLRVAPGFAPDLDRARARPGRPRARRRRRQGERPLRSRPASRATGCSRKSDAVSARRWSVSKRGAAGHAGDGPASRWRRPARASAEHAGEEDRQREQQRRPERRRAPRRTPSAAISRRTSGASRRLTSMPGAGS